MTERLRSDREKIVRHLRRRAVVQKRRLRVHKEGDCPRGRRGDRCPDFAFEQGVYVGLMRALREYGVRPWELDP